MQRRYVKVAELQGWFLHSQKIYLQGDVNDGSRPLSNFKAVHVKIESFLTNQKAAGCEIFILNLLRPFRKSRKAIYYHTSLQLASPSHIFLIIPILSQFMWFAIISVAAPS